MPKMIQVGYSEGLMLYARGILRKDSCSVDESSLGRIKIPVLDPPADSTLLYLLFSDLCTLPWLKLRSASGGWYHH